MASPLTLRLDEETRQRIARIARRKRLSTSEVIRQAIEAWAERQEPAGSPYEAVADLIGVVRGANPKRSEQAGRSLAKLLKSRRNPRRHAR
jgi:Arc/MetJ-type ribon-helix-helix transcriptional regulator